MSATSVVLAVLGRVATPHCGSDAQASRLFRTSGFAASSTAALRPDFGPDSEGWGESLQLITEFGTQSGPAQLSDWAPKSGLTEGGRTSPAGSGPNSGLRSEAPAFVGTAITVRPCPPDSWGGFHYRPPLSAAFVGTVPLPSTGTGLARAAVFRPADAECCLQGPPAGPKWNRPQDWPLAWVDGNGTVPVLRVAGANGYLSGDVDH